MVARNRMTIDKSRCLILFMIISIVWCLLIVSNAAALVDNPKDNLNKSLVLSIGGQKASVNGTIVDMGRDNIPQIVDSRTLIPLRFVSETMGANVTWKSDSCTVEISKGNSQVVMQMGNTVFTNNGKSCSLDVPPAMINDRVFVPIRVLAEALGFNIQFYDPLIVLNKDNAKLSLREKRWLIKNLNIEDAINKMADMIIADIIKPAMTDLEKVYAIFRYFFTETGYDLKAPNRYTASGALVDGRSVCGGNAEAVQVLMKRAGFESHSIIGTVDRIDHAWNIIKLGDKYYHLDVTMNAFLKSDADMKKAYTWPQNSSLICNNDSPAPQGWNFYVKGDYIYYSDFGNNTMLQIFNKSSNFYRVKLDGSGKELLFKSTDSPIWIWTCDGENCYYGLRDGDILYKTNLSTTQTISYKTPILDSGGFERMYNEGGWIYIYTSAYPEGEFFRIKTDGTGCEKIMDDGTAEKCVNECWPVFTHM